MPRHPESETARKNTFKLSLSDLEVLILKRNLEEGEEKIQEVIRRWIWEHVTEEELSDLDTLKLRQKDIARIIEDSREHLHLHRGERDPDDD